MHSTKSRFDDDVINYFEKLSSLALEACEIFTSKTDHEIDNKGKSEIYLFNLYYIWQTIQDRNLLEMSVENAQLFMAAGIVKYNKIKPECELQEFMEIYKDRFTNYRSEFKEFINSHRSGMPYLPKYFFSQIGIRVNFKDEPDPEFSMLELIDSYIHYINSLKLIMDKSL